MTTTEFVHYVFCLFWCLLAHQSHPSSGLTLKSEEAAYYKALNTNGVFLRERKFGMSSYVFNIFWGSLDIFWTLFFLKCLFPVFRHRWCLLKTILSAHYLQAGVSLHSSKHRNVGLWQLLAHDGTWYWYCTWSYRFLYASFCVFRETCRLQWPSVLRQPQHQDNAVGGPANPRVS